MGRAGVRSMAALGAALLALPGTAAGAGWSAPVELSGAKGVEPRVVTSPAGDGVVVWGHKGEDPTVGGGPVSYSTRAPGAGFTTPVPIAPAAGGALVELVSNARGEASATWHGGFTGGTTATPYGTAFRAPGAPFGDAVGVPLGEGQGLMPGPGVSAMDGAGNTTWTWVDPESKRPRAVTRSRDGAFGPLREWGPGVTGTMASDGAGNLVFAWIAKAEGEEGNRVFVASAPPGGTPGPPRAISQEFGGFDLLAHPKLRVVANDRGDFVVAWSAVPRADPQPGTIRSDQTLHVSVRPPGGEFGPAEAVPPHEGRMTGIQEWDLAVSARGDAIASWVDRGQVAAAYRPAGGPIERAHRIDPADDGHDHGMPSVAFDGRRGALIVYEERLAQHHFQIRAVHRPAGGDYGPIRVLDDARHLFTPDVAADADGDAIAAWARQSRWMHDSKEDGVRAAVFDPSMPALTSVALRGAASAPPSVAFKASDTTRVTARFDRRAGRTWERVGKAGAKARRGRNVIRPSRKLAARLRRPGRYRVTLSAPVGGGLETQGRRVEFRVR